ncbi:RWD domain-containing protein 1 isoform X2 [Gouania willdenowi]|uniref:RWD domain-containing protein 1 isoform X2 n=1 Tax=Gouania willdenowi TaxID=441366 RepID=UPI001054EEFE|nr:RWD domain-containing protein 1 isoform X2 [Gouania willdenowi]
MQQTKENEPRDHRSRTRGLSVSRVSLSCDDPCLLAISSSDTEMTDYTEEQINELEALESIYPDSFTVLSKDPTSFTINVTSDVGEDGETVEATLKFTYVEKYPDEAPLWEIHSQENLEDCDMEEVLTLLEMQVAFQGTVVTIENFLVWKAKFEVEMAELRRKKQKEEEQAGKLKLTGKQLFETDHNLDTSDIQFLEDAGNNVEVDESLFQDIEDLDLDENDPDFDLLEMGSDED